jgi:hypothetical protein
MPKDKWFGLYQKTKELWDPIDDKYKSVISGFTKPTISTPTFGKPPSKPPFANPHCNINTHEISAYDFLQAHAHS